jgi:hypothetical protein
LNNRSVPPVARSPVVEQATVQKYLAISKSPTQPHPSETYDLPHLKGLKETVSSMLQVLSVRPFFALVLSNKIKGASCAISSNFGQGLMQPNYTNANLTTVRMTLVPFLEQEGDNFSEDCLTLNVWTKPQVGDKKRAVMI